LAPGGRFGSGDRSGGKVTDDRKDAMRFEADVKWGCRKKQKNRSRRNAALFVWGDFVRKNRQAEELDEELPNIPKQCVGCVWGRWCGTKQVCSMPTCVREQWPSRAPDETSGARIHFRGRTPAAGNFRR